MSCMHNSVGSYYWVTTCLVLPLVGGLVGAQEVLEVAQLRAEAGRLRRAPVPLPPQAQRVLLHQRQPPPPQLRQHVGLGGGRGRREWRVAGSRGGHITDTCTLSADAYRGRYSTYCKYFDRYSLLVDGVCMALHCIFAFTEKL